MEPTAAAELTIKLVAVQDGNALKGTAIIRQMLYEATEWLAEAEGRFFIPSIGL